VTSSVGESVHMKNILFGDVWICGGQSNMQFTTGLGFNATAEINDANNYPNIRVFTVGQSTTSATPLAELAAVEQIWSVSSSASIGGPDWQYFSAVCWFFGKNLYEELNVPIGLVSSNWGGTIIQAWSSPHALSQCSASDEETAAIKGIGGPNDPSQLWNAMIVPLLPMRVSGATWYQAESNVGQTAYYTCAFPVMITDWRNKWGYTAAEFPFFFVQLAPWAPSDMNVPAMRAAQMVALGLPFVGVGTAADLGDALSPVNNIHPRDKQDVGKRLASSALAIAYGRKVQYLGPTPTFAMVLSTSPVAIVEVHFRPDSLGEGLILRQSPVCPPQIAINLCGNTFEMQSSDGKWVAATASISAHHTIAISATIPAGSVPIAVRYIYVPWPLATLFNTGSYNFPAPPFSLQIDF